MTNLTWSWPHACKLPAALPLLAACSAEASGPSDPVLLGTWGASEAEFIAIQAGAELRFGCNTVVIRSPVTLTEANGFARGE
jgi:hypothetical protein